MLMTKYAKIGMKVKVVKLDETESLLGEKRRYRSVVGRIGVIKKIGHAYYHVNIGRFKNLFLLCSSELSRIKDEENKD